MESSMSLFRAPELIESDELLLRPPEPRDAQALYDEIFSDEETVRYLTHLRHTSIDETLVFIGMAQRDWETGELPRWVLEDKATGRLTGLIELQPRPPRAEIGVIISRRGGARRRRAGLDVLRKFLKWLIAQPQICRVFACCAVDGNAHSSMERLGFTLEAKMTNYEARPNLGLLASDSYLYAMTRPLTPPHMADALAWMDRHFSVEPDACPVP
jgi:ribosomal-protein-alanine N-acetyltransferase